MPQHRVAPHLLLLVAVLASLALLPEAAAQPISIVVSTANEGQSLGDGCSLREAIINANNDNQSGSAECLAGSGPDLITFDSDYTIILASTLPALASNLIIDGTGHSITISGNTAVRVFLIQPGAVVMLSQLNIINGNAADYGGGIYNDGGTLALSNSTLSGNSADILGGGIQSNGTVTVSTSTFTGNSAPLGGGIQNSGTLTISTSTFSANSANSAGDSGGGIDSSGGSMLTINASTFNGNLADIGGGIANRGATVTISTSTFSANAASTGGGIFNDGTLTLSASTFSGNSADAIGGGIQNSGTLTLSSSTFSGNSGDEGGGIDSSGGSTLTISTSTFSGNSADFGGGIANRGATLTLSNSLIANSPSGGDCGNAGTMASNLNNLIEDGSCSPAVSGDPLLSPLGSYGGATQTFALLPGSPAIDAGDSASCAATPITNQDQRGVARTFGASCDIGAFESRGFSLGNLSGTPQSAAVTSAFATPLGLTVSSSFGEPVGPGGRVILTAPASGPSIAASTPITRTTSATGVVSQTVTANGLWGSYRVTASSRGASGAANFELTNRCILYVPLIRR
jgi:hypothetical protein